MTDQLFSITGVGGSRLLCEVLGVLTHRRVKLRAFHACSVGNRFQILVLVDMPDEASTGLLARRFDRILGVTNATLVSNTDAHYLAAVRVRVEGDELSGQRTVGDVVAELPEAPPAAMGLSHIATPNRVTNFMAVHEPAGARERAESGTVALRRRLLKDERPAMPQVVVR